MQLVGIQIYNLDIARIKNQRNEKQLCIFTNYTIHIIGKINRHNIELSSRIQRTAVHLAIKM